MWPFSNKKALQNEPKNTETDEEKQERLAQLAHSRALQRQKRALDFEVLVKQKELEKAQIEQQIAELYDDDEESDGVDLEGALMGLLQHFMQGNGIQPGMQPGMSPMPAPVVEQEPQRQPYTEEAMREIWESLPAHQRAIAKVMPDEKIKSYIHKREPELSEEELNLAVKVVRS